MFELLFWAGLAIALWYSWVLFRDLADVPQLVIPIPRERALASWYQRHRLTKLAIAGLLVAIASHLLLHAGHGPSLWFLGGVATLLWFCGYIHPHIMMRPQQEKARFVPLAEARKRLRAETCMVVIEHNGVARAHAESEIFRPHVVGTPEGLGGENVVMTYCAMSNLGMAVKPEVDGKPLDLAPAIQLENNLIMWDRNTGEPVQQIHHCREGDRNSGKFMEEWPSFRMPLWAFEKAYPHGEVFLNIRPRWYQNPFASAYDLLIEMLFTTGISYQHRFEKPICDTMKHYDDRLPHKEYVWGFNVDDDYVAFDRAYLREQDDLINVEVGGRSVVVAYDADYDSIGVYYNDTGVPVAEIDFFGDTPRGRLRRVETLKAGLYWFIWCNFFPQTDLNRVAVSPSIAEAA